VSGPLLFDDTLALGADLISRERLYGIPDEWQRFAPQAHRERKTGPRYVEAIRGARGIREFLRATQWHLVPSDQQKNVLSQWRPTAYPNETDGGIPPGWITR